MINLKLWKTLTRILEADLLLALAVGGSFLFTQDFSAAKYSDRLFIVGVAVMFVGTLGVFAVISGVRGINIVKAWTPEQAKELRDSTGEILEAREKRYTIIFQIWLIGLGCLIFSAVIYLLLVQLGIGV